MAVDRNSDLLRLLPEGEETDQAIAVFELADDVAAQLRGLRKRAALSQAQLAEKLGITQSRISQLESGLVDHAPSLEMIARFATACGARPTMSFQQTDAELDQGAAAEWQVAEEPHAFVEQTAQTAFRPEETSLATFDVIGAAALPAASPGGPLALLGLGGVAAFKVLQTMTPPTIVDPTPDAVEAHPKAASEAGTPLPPLLTTKGD